MKIKNKHIFELHADFCKMIANPKRLMIIWLLAHGEMSVGQIVKAMHTRLSNVSQHLRVLRSRNVVATRKDGQTVYYHLTDKRINKVGVEIRKILLDSMKKRGELARGLRL